MYSKYLLHSLACTVLSFVFPSFKFKDSSVSAFAFRVGTFLCPAKKDLPIPRSQRRAVIF